MPTYARRNQNLPGQLIFKVKVPLVVNRRFRIPVLTGHIRKRCVIRIQKTGESSGQINCRRSYSVAVKRRLEKEWKVVVDLQWVASADLIEHKETTIACADYERF